MREDVIAENRHRLGGLNLISLSICQCTLNWLCNWCASWDLHASHIIMLYRGICGRGRGLRGSTVASED